MPASANSHELQLPMKRARHPYLAPGLALALTCAGAGWLLSEPVVDLLSGPPRTAPSVALPTVGENAPPAPVVDLGRLSENALFGRYDPTAAVSASSNPIADPTVATLPDTAPAVLPEANLAVALNGVVFAPRAQDRRAIIAAGGGQPTAYAIDDPLPGDAVIRFIEPRRIVVEHDGELKAVSLPESELGGAAAAAAYDAAAGQP